jgi:hypothetical protein
MNHTSIIDIMIERQKLEVLDSTMSTLLQNEMIKDLFACLQQRKGMRGISIAENNDFSKTLSLTIRGE